MSPSSALAERIAALEARDNALTEQITALREDLRRHEARLYAIVATGILAGSAASGLVSHFTT